MAGVRVRSLGATSREDLLEQARPFAFAALTMNQADHDSMDFNVEVFQVSAWNDTTRIANYGGARRKYDADVLARTICLFVNK